MQTRDMYPVSARTDRCPALEWPVVRFTWRPTAIQTSHVANSYPPLTLFMLTLNTASETPEIGLVRVLVLDDEGV